MYNLYYILYTTYSASLLRCAHASNEDCVSGTIYYTTYSIPYTAYSILYYILWIIYTIYYILHTLRLY